jgi:acetyl-CoA C-acetyltransferase
MTTRLHQQIPDNTPVIVGTGQCVERLDKHGGPPPFNSPMQLASMACQAALRDAGVSANQLDTIAVIRLFSDAAKAWQSPFGGSNNPPESIAQRIGATPARRIYSDVGGTEPLQMMVELFQALAQGEQKLAVLAGAEAIASQRFAVRNGHELNWREEFDIPLDNREYRKRFAARGEIASGLSLPVHYYALIENIQAHQMRHNLQQHREYMAQLLAPFSEVAASNPYAQLPVVRSVRDLATPGPDNYPISLPYSKLLVAQDAVNQAAALLLTTAGHARQLGIDPRQWVFLEAYANGIDHYLSQREDPGRSQAMERVLAATMARVGATAAEMDLIDIYSCFPCAIHAACEALELPTDGSRPLTVTGGLPFFGGPGNNYSMHALAEAAVRLRGDPVRALVTANGGMLSKHAAAVLTSEAAGAAGMEWNNNDVWTVDCSNIAARPLIAQPIGGKIISYTVITRRDRPDIGIVLGETTSGERFLASSTEAADTGAMCDHSPIGRPIGVHAGEGRQLFSFRDA